MFAVNILVLLLLTTFISCQPIQEYPDFGFFGGHTIDMKRAPFTVSLRLDGKYHCCGGSIYDQQFILTAAHCIVKNRKYKVLVGTNKLHQGGTLYDVEKIFVHPRYNNITFDYDISILRLREPLVFSRIVNRLDLTHYRKELKNGTMLEIVGWGAGLSGKITETLRDVRLSVVPRDICQRAYGKNVIITPRMICAGKRGEDGCRSDGGGPLIWRHVQIGIASFNNKYCFLPTVYTDVSKMLRWISYIIFNNRY